MLLTISSLVMTFTPDLCSRNRYGALGTTTVGRGAGGRDRAPGVVGCCGDWRAELRASVDNPEQNRFRQLAHRLWWQRLSPCLC
jgi:hypothetical protein